MMDGRYAIRVSGTPHPRRNASGIFPWERNSVSMPTVLGPPWKIPPRPLVPEKSTSAKTVRQHAASRGFAPLNSGHIEIGMSQVGTRKVGLGEDRPAEIGSAGDRLGGVDGAKVGPTEVRDRLALRSTAIPLPDALPPPLEQFESLVAIHVGDPYNEFFDARNPRLNLPETTRRIEVPWRTKPMPRKWLALSRWLFSASWRSRPPLSRGTSRATE